MTLLALQHGRQRQLQLLPSHVHTQECLELKGWHAESSLSDRGRATGCTPQRRAQRPTVCRPLRGSSTQSSAAHRELDSPIAAHVELHHVRRMPVAQSRFGNAQVLEVSRQVCRDSTKLTSRTWLQLHICECHQVRREHRDVDSTSPSVEINGPRNDDLTPPAGKRHRCGCLQQDFLTNCSGRQCDLSEAQVAVSGTRCKRCQQQAAPPLICVRRPQQDADLAIIA
mmetsp:Transcript_17223/g.40415  ORF Transcript_17223/g.40415 Transcript_17223/m.40415 type:complete len:226 (+) Transcript_17223:522-1199(+)